MQFESLAKLTGPGNATIVTSQTDVDALMNSMPVTENVSGLNEGDTIVAIHEYAAIVPNIGGAAQRPTIVLECEVKGKNDEGIRRRPIYLSTLMRKIDLEKPFQGMIGSDPIFANKSNFTNKHWYDAFKAAAPFHVEGVNTTTRKVQLRSAGGGERDIRVREVILKKGMYSEAGQLQDGQSDASKSGKKDAKN